MLYVRVNVTITAEMNVNKTKTIKGVKADIRQDLDEYLWPVVRVFMSNLPLMTSLLSVPWIIFRAHRYVAKYVTDLSFDNTFLDYELEEIDRRRKHKDKTYLFPLETWETFRYITLFTLRLNVVELFGLVRAFIRVLLLVSVIISLFYMDFGLYYLTASIKLPLNVGVASESRQYIEVQGNGSVHNILAAMVNFTSRAHTVIPDLSPCRPRVTEPNYEQYCRIAIWCVTYGLFEIVVITWRRRMYHVVAAAVYPERQKLRARWLALHIMAERKLVHHTERLVRIYQPHLNARLSNSFIFYEPVFERYKFYNYYCYCRCTLASRMA
ncbi:hypothetical protein LSH36_196g09007 [Paralvinella palmiformis]|uniref:Dendritic cell-specific transmembrane protein-like domain-containing protein n=1 Tax=Paralvinella palmiformis TaxID=53620 RepID=A0AAD9JPW6_9ANNE|nr:hypothetical protein LSH36_196g09007 [Paralvinella palmiformis]